ncbi:MAG TPA: cupin domain-containing protein [Hyphomonadaceae bacterium]|nr:cupin domain-containing protein [Hyphomonadaceae bacterium]
MDDATRAALASGRAEPAVGLFIESLMEMRGLALEAGEVVAGAALEVEAPVELATDALASVFAAIDAAPAAAERGPHYPDLIRLPRRLADAMLKAEAHRGWTTAAPGVRKLRLDVGGEARAELIRLEAGVATPWHTHKGRELTLCLLGGFSDGFASYGPGDISIADPTVRHRPKADDDGPCVVLAVTDAGLKFEGVLGAIQKLTGG